MVFDFDGSQALLINYIRQAKQQISDLSLFSEDTENTPDKLLAQFENDIKNSRLTVPIIGGFSVGKSSLINAFLGRHLLPEAVAPETAIATELHYQTEEYIEAVDMNNQVLRYRLDQLIELKDNSQNYQFLRIYLNNRHLAELHPIILVDMPGFGAAKETSAHHLQAINNYINRAICFIVLNAASKGTIESNIERELENLESWNKAFVIGLTKTNLRTKSDVDEVADSILEAMEDRFDYAYPIFRFGQVQNIGGVDYQNEIRRNVIEMIKCIQPVEQFKTYFADLLYENNKQLQSAIQTQIETFKADEADIQESIAYFNKDIERINNSAENKVNMIQSRYSLQTATSIVLSATSAIASKESILVDYLLNERQNEFTAKIKDIISDVVPHELKKRISELSHQIIEDFKVEIEDALDESHNNLLGDSFLEDIRKVAENLAKEIKLEKSDYGSLNTGGLNLVQMVASLITQFTKNVPILGAAIELGIKLLFGGNDKERGPSPEVIRDRNKMRISQELSSKIIPNIEQELSKSLNETLSKEIKNLVTQVGDKFKATLEMKKSSILASLQEKQANKDDLEALIEKLNKAKAALEQLTENLK